MQVGNMYDINHMKFKDFLNLLDYVEYRDKKQSGKPVPIKESQKDMIKRLKERDVKEDG